MNTALRRRMGLGDNDPVFGVPYNPSGQAWLPRTFDELNNYLGEPPPLSTLTQQQRQAPQQSGIGLKLTSQGLQLPGGSSLSYPVMGIVLIAFALLQHKGVQKRK